MEIEIATQIRQLKSAGANLAKTPAERGAINNIIDTVAEHAPEHSNDRTAFVLKTILDEPEAPYMLKLVAAATAHELGRLN